MYVIDMLSSDLVHVIFSRRRDVTVSVCITIINPIYIYIYIYIYIFIGNQRIRNFNIVQIMNMTYIIKMKLIDTLHICT